VSETVVEPVVPQRVVLPMLLVLGLEPDFELVAAELKAVLVYLM